MHENMNFVKLLLHLAEKEKKVESEPDDSSITDSDDEPDNESAKSSSESDQKVAAEEPSDASESSEDSVEIEQKKQFLN